MRSDHRAWRVVALAVACAGACSGPEDAEAPAPIVAAVEPACGDASAATPVIVRGSLPVHAVISVSDPDRSEMTTAYRAWIGGVELTDVRWTSTAELRAVVPPGIAPSTYGVTVEAPSGKRATREAAFEVRQGPCPARSATLAIVDPAAAPATSVVGQQVTVTATVRNDGLAAATNVTASIVSAPAGLALTEGPSGPVDVLAGQARTFTWTYGTTAPGGGVFVIDATGTASDTGQPIAALQKSTNAIVVNPALFLTAETVVYPQQATVGQLVSVALTATNHATSAALVTPVIAATGPVTAGGSPIPQSIPAGSSRIFQWTFTANAPGTASFTASVSATAPGTGDPVTVPTAQIDVVVQSAPALSASLEILPPFELGDLTVRMRVSNTGGPSAANVVEVVPDTPAVQTGSTAHVTLKSGPTGSPATVVAGQPDVEFTWVFTATARGTLTLASAARGKADNARTDVASATAISNLASIGRFTVGGSVTGYDGQGLILQNGAETLPIGSGARTYAFPTPIPSGGAYNVTVATQPTDESETCTVSNGTGMIGAADVTDANVTCSKRTFTVGGTVSGLLGTGLVLHNGSDDLPVAANGAFQFPTPVASGGTYEVSVSAQPALPAQTCSVANGNGRIGSANVTNVHVTCSTNAYTVGGTVTGLAGTGLVLGNGAESLPVSANGAFTFAARVPSGGSYSVTVTQQPAGPAQTCAVTNGSGVVTGADIASVTVTCSTNAYAVGGTVTGLAGTGLVLRNGTESLAVSANGAFTFATRVPSGGSYDVTVAQQPAGPTQTCAVTNGSGIVAGADIASVTVSCTTNSYTIGGTVTGLAAAGLVLHNGSDDLAIPADGPFQFPTAVVSGGSYDVTVAQQPAPQACTVASGSGIVAGANVTAVAISCL